MLTYTQHSTGATARSSESPSYHTHQQQQQPATTKEKARYRDFTQFPNWLFDDSPLPYVAQVGFERLWRRYAYRGGIFTGSIYDLEGELHIPKSSIHRMIERWQAEGLIIKERPRIKGSRGRERSIMRLTIPIQDIWQKNADRHKIVPIRPNLNLDGEGQTGGQTGENSSDTSGQNVPEVDNPDACEENQNVPDGGISIPEKTGDIPDWDRCAPPWDIFEGENHGNRGNTTTNVVSNTHLIPGEAAKAECVSSSFSSQEEDERDTSPPGNGQEEETSSEFLIANTPIEQSFTPSSSIEYGYMKTDGVMKEESVFPQWETPQEVVTWCNQQQSYPLRTNQLQTALHHAEELLRDYSVVDIIMTFLFMKYICPFWSAPARAGMMNIFSVNKHIQEKNIERQTTSWSLFVLPRQYHVYYQEVEMLRACQQAREGTAGSTQTTEEETEEGTNTSMTSQHTDHQSEAGWKEVYTPAIERTLCDRLGCEHEYDWTDALSNQWCEQHKGRGELINMALEDGFPNVAYATGQTHEGKQAWRRWICLVSDEQVVNVTSTLTYVL